jgi:hypothetical protein
MFEYVVIQHCISSAILPKTLNAVGIYVFVEAAINWLVRFVVSVPSFDTISLIELYLFFSCTEENNYKLKLDQTCNRTADADSAMIARERDRMECDTNCSRAQCIFGYRPEQTNCGMSENHFLLMKY